MTTFVTNPAQIQAGETESSVVDCGGDLAAIIFPDDWNGEGIKFQVSADNIDYCDLYYLDGHDVGVAVKPGGAVIVSPDIGRAIRFLRLISNVEQTDDRVFGVVLAVAGTAPARAARRKTPRKTAKSRRKHR